MWLCPTCKVTLDQQTGICPQCGVQHTPQTAVQAVQGFAQVQQSAEQPQQFQQPQQVQQTQQFQQDTAVQSGFGQVQQSAEQPQQFQNVQQSAEQPQQFQNAPQSNAQQPDVDLLGVAKQQFFSKVKNSRKKVMDGSNSGKLNLAAVSTVILGYVGMALLFIPTFVVWSVSSVFYSDSDGLSLMQLIVASGSANVVGILIMLGMLGLTLCGFSKTIPAGVKNTVAIFVFALLVFSSPVSGSVDLRYLGASTGPGGAYVGLCVVALSYTILAAIAGSMEKRADKGLKNTGGVIGTIVVWLVILATLFMSMTSFRIPFESSGASNTATDTPVYSPPFIAPQEPQKVQCLTCNGAGTIRDTTCDGAGWLFNPSSGNRDIRCYNCNDGWYDCSYCNGTGWR